MINLKQTSPKFHPSISNLKKNLVEYFIIFGHLNKVTIIARLYLQQRAKKTLICFRNEPHVFFRFNSVHDQITTSAVEAQEWLQLLNKSECHPTIL